MCIYGIYCRWALLIDQTEQVATFMRYQDVNMLTAVDPRDMQPEKIRTAVIGSLR